MSILQNIVDKTRAKLDERKAELTLSQIKISLQDLNLPKSRFKEKLAHKSEAIIAEIKTLRFKTSSNKSQPKKIPNNGVKNAKLATPDAG